MKISLYIIQIILSVSIVALVLLQAKGGGLGSIFSGSGGVYRTRRGVEKTLYQATIGLAVAFFVISLIIVSFSNL